MKPNWDQYVWFVLLFLYVLLKYFGSIQRNGSAYFEDYISLRTAEIEGCGAVFGYIMSAPIIEAVLAVLLSSFFIGLFFFTEAIFLKSRSAIGKLLLMVLLIVLCSFGIAASFKNILLYGQWNFTILILAELSFLLYLVYYVFFTVWIQKRSVRID